MKKPKITKITPYFRGLTPKVRVIIYLLGTGRYTFDSIRRVTVGEFKALGLESILPVSLELMDICNELVAGRDVDEAVFCNTSGRTYSIRDLTEMLKRAHKIAGVPYQGLQAFVNTVN